MDQFSTFTSPLSLDPEDIVLESIDVECEAQKVSDVMGNGETFTIKKRMKGTCNSIIWWEGNKGTQVGVKSPLPYVVRQILYNKMWVDYDDINESTANMPGQLMRLLWRSGSSASLEREYCTGKFFEDNQEKLNVATPKYFKLLVLPYENLQPLTSHGYQSHQLTLEMFEGETLTYLLGHDPELNTRQNHAQWQTGLANIQASLMAFQFPRGGSLGFVDSSQKYEIQEDGFTGQEPFENEQAFWTTRARYRQTRTRKELERTPPLDPTKSLTLTCHNIIKQHLRQASFKHPVYLLRNYDLGYHNVIAREINGKWRIVAFFDLDAVVAVPLSACLGAPMFSRVDPRPDVVLSRPADMSTKRPQPLHSYVRYLDTLHDHFPRCSEFYNEISKLRTSGMLLVYLGLETNVFVNEKKWLKWIRTTIGDVQDSDWEFLDDLSSDTDCSITSSSEVSNSWEEEFNSSCTSSDIEANGSIVSQESDDIYESALSESNTAVARLTTLAVSKEHFINRGTSDMFSILGQTWCEVFYSRPHTFIEIEIWNGKSVLCVNQDMIAKILCLQSSCDTIALTVCLELMVYVGQHRVQHHSKTSAKSIDITFFPLALGNGFYNDVAKALVKLLTLQPAALLNMTPCVTDEERDGFTHRRSNIGRIRQYLLSR